MKEKQSGRKIVAKNPNSRNYIIEELVEAGIALQGTEVKSLRAQAPNLRDAFVEVKPKAGKVEAWLVNAHIAPYSHGNIWNHEPLRRRKLLLHGHQLRKLLGQVTRKGAVIVPTQLYLLKGLFKIELAVGKGKKAHDKREDLKKKASTRDLQHAMKRNR